MERSGWKKQVLAVIQWDGMFLNVERLWINSEYHTAVVWCLSTGKKLENVIFLSKKAADDK